MPEYELDADGDESLTDVLDPDEEVVNIEYVGGKEKVETKEGQTTQRNARTLEELQELDRDQLYNMGQGQGVQLNWSGGNAHSKDEMAQKLANHFNEGE